MRIAVAQLGARLHYAVPRIFHEAGMLERLFTDSYVGNKPWLERTLRAVPEAVRPRAVDRWLGRKEPAIPPEKVTSFEAFGMARVRREAKARPCEATRVAAETGRRFNDLVLRHGLGRADTVWGFNGASLELFRHARRLGLATVLEQTMAPWRSYGRLLREEAARWPGWQPNLWLPPEDDPLLRREEAEWRLADLIVCGSRFVVDELARCGGPLERCVVVPYGVDPARFPPAPRRGHLADDRLRVLFAGEVGLRKGAPYLLEALRQLGPERVEARFAGPIAVDRNKLGPYREVATFLGPVPRTKMPTLFHWADVFVLPSVCEGSATVIYEAVVSGVPVICTQNAGSIECDDTDKNVLTVARPDRLASLLNGYIPCSHANHALRPLISLQAYAARLLQAVDAIRLPHQALT